MQQENLKVDDQTISVQYFSPSKDRKKLALLFLHGWRGRPNHRAAALMAQNGYPSLTLIMRGHEGSEGDIKSVTATDSLADAIAAYDFVKQQVGEDYAVAAIGNSYGSYIAILLTEQRPLAALSLRVPASYPDGSFNQPKWGRGHDDPEVDAWRRTAVHYAENHAFQLLHNFPGEVQIIEGEKDDIVPARTVKNYVESVSDPEKLEYLLMKGWPHSLGDDPRRNQQFQTVLLEWAHKVESRL